MKNSFNKNKWFYYPINLFGYLISLILLIFIIQIFIIIDLKSHSGSDTLYGFFPYLISTLVIYWWIASRLSR